MSQPLPLAGIRVVDYSHFLAGPHMSRCLSAMGAEVIKVERPTSGDAGRAARTCCTSSPTAPTCSSRTTAPGALNKLGLGYE